MDIGGIFVKLGLDFSPFKKGMSEAKQSLTGLNQEMNKSFSTAGVNNYAETLSGLRLQLKTARNDFAALISSNASLEEKTSSLNKQIEIQQQVIAKANEQYQKSVNEKGELSKSTLLLQQKLSSEHRTMAQLEAQLKQLNTVEEQTASITRRTGDSFFRFGNIIKSSVIFGGVFAGLNAISDGFKAAVGGGIKFDSQMQQNQISFSTMLGSADKAKSLMSDIVNMASTTPFETSDLTKASQQLLAFGISNEKIIPTLKMLGDVSQGNKERFDSLTLAFAQIQSAGKIQGGDLLQLVNAGFNPLQIISEKTGKSMAELRKEMEKGSITSDMVTQAFQDATNKGGMFFNAMQSQSTTFSGLMSTLQDNLHTTFGTMMQPVFEYLTNTALPKAIEMTTKFTDALKSGGAIQAFKTIIPANVVDDIVKFGKEVKDSFGWIQEHSEGIKTAVLTIGSAFLTFKTITGAINLVKDAMIALNLVMELNPYVAAATVIAGIAVLIYRNWNEIKTFLSDTWNTIKNIASDAWNGISNLASDIWNGIKNSVVDSMKWMYDHNYYFKDLVDFISNAWTNIRTFTAEVWTSISQKLSELWTKISGQATKEWNGIYNFISGIWTKITEGFNKMITSAFDWGKNLMNEFIDGFKSMISRLWDAVSDAAKTVSDFLGFHSPTKEGPGRDADKWAPNFMKMFAQGIEDNLPMIKDKLNSMAFNLNPNIALSGVGGVTNTTNYGGIYINVSGGTSSDQADQLLRELRKRGIRV